MNENSLNRSRRSFLATSAALAATAGVKLSTANAQSTMPGVSVLADTLSQVGLVKSQQMRDTFSSLL